MMEQIANNQLKVLNSVDKDKQVGDAAELKLTGKKRQLTCDMGLNSQDLNNSDLI